jgi:hypothetical protein
MLLTAVTTLDQEVLKKVGVNGSQAIGNLIPENIVFNLSNKAGLSPTANGFRTGSTPNITNQLRNNTDINQMLTFKKYQFNDNKGYLFINGTSKVISRSGSNLVVSEFKENYNIFYLSTGFAPNSIILSYGGDQYSSIASIKRGSQSEYINYNTQDNDQLFYLNRISGIKSQTVDNSNKEILKDGETYTFSNYSGLGFAATEFRDGTSPNIYSKIKNVNDRDQQFVWKRYNNELDKGYLQIKGTTKVIGRLDSFLTVKEFEENYNIFYLSRGFSIGSIIFSYGGSEYSAINNSKSGSSSSVNQRVSYYNYNDLDLDQIFYVNNPNQNPIFGPGTGITPPKVITNNPSTTTTSNQPLIPSGYVFTMAAKHGWAVDGNNYKTSKTKRAFAYPRNKADPEQVIKWEPSNGKDTGYLRLNGTDLTWVRLKGPGGYFLTLQKYAGTEAQRWDVKLIPGVKDAYYLQDRSSKAVITINPENGYDVHVDPIISGDIRQYMVVNKIK